MAKLRKFSAGLVLMLVVGTAIAQAPSPPSPATSEQSGAMPMSLTAQDFVNQASRDGMTEVELARLALKQSQNVDVKRFAHQMVTDHTDVNSELKMIAQQKSLQVPSTLDQEHNTLVQLMSSKTGADFDATYLREMVSAHDKAVTLFKIGVASRIRT